jgi:hypothetical protein
MGNVAVSTPEDSLTVRYSAKELFARIDSKLDHLLEVIPTKADVVALEELEHRVSMLETREAERKGSSLTLKAILGALILILGALVPIVAHYLP